MITELKSIAFDAVGKYDVNKWGADLHDIYRYCKEILPMPPNITDKDFEHDVCGAISQLKEKGLTEAGAARGYHKLTDFGRTCYKKGIDPQEINRIAEANYINKRIKGQ
jgi:hypothetical protein